MLQMMKSGDLFEVSVFLEHREDVTDLLVLPHLLPSDQPLY